MKVHFIGSGAAPSMPVPFCICDSCSLARERGGKNLRRRSSLLVDNEILLDLGPDTATGGMEQGIALDAVRMCLLTHPHDDHIDPEFLISRHSEWGTLFREELRLGASRKTLEQIDLLCSRRCSYGTIFDPDVQTALRLRVEELSAYSTFEYRNYRITPYPANHAPGYDAFLYSIEEGQRAVFYGTDTSTISESVWNHMEESGVRYDLMILDHTYGIGFESSDHLCAAAVEEYASILRDRRILKSTGTVYATHLSHEGIREHGELDRYAAARGYRIAYDGLTVQL